MNSLLVETSNEQGELVDSAQPEIDSHGDSVDAASSGNEAMVSSDALTPEPQLDTSPIVAIVSGLPEIDSGASGNASIAGFFEQTVISETLNVDSVASTGDDSQEIIADISAPSLQVIDVVNSSRVHDASQDERTLPEIVAGSENNDSSFPFIHDHVVAAGNQSESDLNVYDIYNSLTAADIADPFNASDYSAPISSNTQTAHRNPFEESSSRDLNPVLAEFIAPMSEGQLNQQDSNILTQDHDNAVSSAGSEAENTIVIESDSQSRVTGEQIEQIQESSPEIANPEIGPTGFEESGIEHDMHTQQKTVHLLQPAVPVTTEHVSSSVESSIGAFVYAFPYSVSDYQELTRIQEAPTTISDAGPVHETQLEMQELSAIGQSEMIHRLRNQLIQSQNIRKYLNARIAEKHAIISQLTDAIRNLPISQQSVPSEMQPETVAEVSDDSPFTSCRTELRTAQARISELEATLTQERDNARQSIQAQMNSAAGSSARFQAQVRQAQQAGADALRTAAEREIAIDELQVHSGQAAPIRTPLEEVPLAEVRSETSLKLETAPARIAELEAALAAVQAQIDAAARQLNRAQQERDDLLGVATSQLDETHAEIRDLKNRLHTTDTALQECEGRVNVADSRNSALESSAASEKQALEDQIARFKALSDAVKTFTDPAAESTTFNTAKSLLTAEETDAQMIPFINAARLALGTSMWADWRTYFIAVLCLSLTGIAVLYFYQNGLFTAGASKDVADDKVIEEDGQENDQQQETIELP